MESEKLPYQRLLLKLSGEAMAGEQNFGLCPRTVRAVAREIGEVWELQVQIGVVIGGGNIFRGVAASAQEMDRAQADYMGMLATVINSLALQDALEKEGVPARVMSAISMMQVAEPYIRRRAIRHLEKGRVVIFAAGTGNPFFTTDTAAALRAIEIGAQALLKGTKVDGVYNQDPVINPQAQKYDHLGYMEVIQRGLKVMDTTAVTMALEQHLPIIVFKLLEPGNMKKLLQGQNIGTVVEGDTYEELKLCKEMKRKMDRALEVLGQDFARIRTGRASVALLEGIKVDAYGTSMPISQVASLAAPEPRLLTVQPWDTALMSDLEKAILRSDLGLTPSNDGKIIRIPIPPLTTERRKELVKSTKKMTEESKVALRNLRRDANEQLKELKKDKQISEDEAFKAQDEVQKVTDDYIKKLDALAAEKEKEIMSF